MTAATLAGLVCVVTGAGRGIGRETALELARRGARVAICARSADELAGVGSVLTDVTREPHCSMTLDVCDAGAVEAFAGEVESTLGSVGLLINNAATLGPVGAMVDVDARVWLDTFAVNVGAIAITAQAFVPRMPAGGSIVNLSGGGVGGPSAPTNVSAYTASKAAVVQLTETMSRELRDHHIRVNAVAPGAVATRFTEPVLDAGPAVAGELYELTVSQRKASTPLAPFFDLVEYLATDEGAWVTGRFLSARWDGVEVLNERRHEIEGSNSLFTLRRIDGTLFGALEDR